ncbi:MAG TPA: AAA family ATPase [Candidatus Acidoferrales bacterium]|nr:AAA family ATPase [Candidatus Acidoferrales bacterium]
MSPERVADSVALFENATEDEIVLVPASSIKPERVMWAWEQRIPNAMVSLLVGEGGLGKSVELCSLAAGWSRGTIPGDFYGVPVDVAIASAEDHRRAVIIPRLLAAGADLSRIHFLEHRIDGDAEDIAINGEVAALEAALVAGHVRVVMIDTVVAHIPVKHDTYNEQNVRAVLKPLAKMAERNDLVVLGVMHLNRREARDILTRISGSGAFGNLARSVLLWAADPDDPEGATRILAIGKSNVGGRAPALKLALQGCVVPHDSGVEIPAVRLVDAGASDFTTAQLLGVPPDEEKRTAVTEAIDFLRDYLADGLPHEAQAVKTEAAKAGISDRTLRRAAKELSVNTHARGGFGEGFPSRWCLAPAHTRVLSAVGHVEQVGSLSLSLYGQHTHLYDTDGQDGTPQARARTRGSEPRPLGRSSKPPTTIREDTQ